MLTFIACTNSLLCICTKHSSKWCCICFFCTTCYFFVSCFICNCCFALTFYLLYFWGWQSFCTFSTNYFWLFVNISTYFCTFYSNTSCINNIFYFLFCIIRIFKCKFQCNWFTFYSNKCKRKYFSISTTYKAFKTTTTTICWCLYSYLFTIISAFLFPSFSWRCSPPLFAHIEII